MFKKLLLPAIAIAVSFAQPPGLGPGRGIGQGMGIVGQGATPTYTELKAYLNLSDTQISSITAAIKSTADADRTLMQSIREKNQALQTLLNSGSTDAAAVGKPMIEIRDLRKQAATTNTKIQEQALSFLTADQKTKLKALEDAEKLAPAIGQAHALHLLTAPVITNLVGPGTPGGPGPRGFGRSFGRRMM